MTEQDGGQIPSSTTVTDTTNNHNQLPIHPLSLPSPLTPPAAGVALNLPMTDLKSTSSELTTTGLSNQSMRTSSFAMSDFSDNNDDAKPCSSPFSSTPPQQQLQHLESTRIRKAYSRPSAPRKKWRTTDNPSENTENLDYFDEKDFRNTDRYIPIPPYNIQEGC